jgi:acid phosphatase (class A)
MRARLACAVAVMTALGGPAWAQGSARIPPQNILTPPPARDSMPEKDEIAELLAMRSAAAPAALEQAARDQGLEGAPLFADVIGARWHLAKLPKTKFLTDQVLAASRADAGKAAAYFHRARPSAADARIKPCAPQGNAADSYPDARATAGFAQAIVLASLMPERGSAILARATRHGENAIVCGLHFRSDVSAGQQLGTALAMQLMNQPGFKALFSQAQAELKGAGLAR